MQTDPIHLIPSSSSGANSLKLSAGKLPAALLGRLLADLPTQHPQLVLGPGIGEDAAVIDFTSDRLLVVKSDPITFATDEIGFYAVNVCANDLAVTGATPRFYLPTILLPEGKADTQSTELIFRQLAKACRHLGIVVAGGHSEITAAVNQPVIAGTMLGEVDRGRFVRSAGCRPGDIVLLAGIVPVEGTSLIAREKRADLQRRGWASERLDEAAHYLYDPGISVLRPALDAANKGLVTAMHDPTEGGIATGLLEMAIASGNGLEINLDAIPIPPLAVDLCAEYGLDPLGTIASGALLATAKPADAVTLLAAWQESGWRGTVIGRILPPDAGIYALRDGQQVALPRFDADEIVKLWR
jgi:hydrogenase maturation factor